MAADKELELNLKTTGDTAGVEKVTSAIQQVSQAAKAASTEAVQMGSSTATALQQAGQAAQTASLNTVQLGTATATVSDGMEKATKSTSGFGQAALTAAYFADDMQYGIKGILNNIPGLVMGLGMGAGVAGVVSILAVGLGVASDKLDLFGSSSDKATDRLKELRKDTRDAAAEARVAAEHNEAMAETQRLHTAAMDEAQAKYDSLKDSIEENAKSRQSLAAALDREAEAQAELDKAKIETQRINGVINEQEAERLRLLVERGREEARQRREQEEFDKKRGDLSGEADGLRSQANTSLSEARKLENASQNLLTPKRREELKKQAEDAQVLLDLEQAKKVPETIQREIKYNDSDSLNRRVGVGILGDIGAGKLATETVPNPAFEEQQRLIREAGATVAETTRRLADDKAAQDSTGLSDPQVLRERTGSLYNQTDDLRKKAAQRDAEAARTGNAAESDSRVFDIENQTREVQSGNRVQTIQSRQSEAEAREARRNNANQERERQRQGQKQGQKQGRELDSQANRAVSGIDSGLAENITAATEALKDGATEEELKNVGAAILALAQTATEVGERKKNELNQLFRDVKALHEKLKKDRS